MCPGNARNVGGIRSRSGRRPVPEPEHYLTAREAADIARACKKKDQARGIFRRWNDRKLNEEEQRLVDDHKKRSAFHARRKKRRKATANQERGTKN